MELNIWDKSYIIVIGDDMHIDVEFYTTEDGKKPAKEFLLSLEPKMRAKMVKTIELLENNGPELRMPYSEYLGNGIFELRAKVGSYISRELYFFFCGQKAVLTNGFVKKTRRTPQNQLQTAAKYKDDYEKRVMKNE